MSEEIKSKIKKIEISTVAFKSERLENFLRIFLSILGLYQELRSTSPANIIIKIFPRVLKIFRILYLQYQQLFLGH